jgi:uncharacterized protein (DUF362 family)/ferredoxin
MPRVAIAACPDYQDDRVSAAVEAALSALDDAVVVRPGERLLLKPNLLSAVGPDRAATTHPAVFAAVARALAARGAVLSYGDSPGIESPERAARASGIAEAAEALGIPLEDFTLSEAVENPQGRVLKSFHLVRAVRAADGLVDLPKFKTHALCTLTGAVKNLFGCIPGTLKAKEHVRNPSAESFSAMVVDLAAFLRPRLCVMDAVVGMEGNGPRSGTPRTIGLILASTDPVAMDAVCASLAGLAPAAVPTTRIGGETGLGVADLACIEVVFFLPASMEAAVAAHRERPDEPRPIPPSISGTAAAVLAPMRLPDFRLPDAERSTIRFVTTKGVRFLRRAVLNRPTIDPVRCTRCGACVRACPVEPKALAADGPREVPYYDYSRCIRCFCCQEFCPSGAIDVRKAPLGFLLGPKSVLPI